jgi:hypothetical protein
MSDTEDTEELIPTKKIISINNQNSSKEINQKEEITKITTIEIISDLLVNICEENKNKKCNKNYLLKSFTNKNIPSISIKDYLLRLSKHSKVNESTIILILIYIDRICNMNHFILTYYNIHKMILAAFILAIKYNEDGYYSMNYYSKIGGITLSELNNLESEYLILIGYNLLIQPKLYNKYYNDLMSLKCEENDDEENEEEFEAQEDDDDEDEKEENENMEENNNYNLNKKNNNINLFQDLNQIGIFQNKNVNTENYEREISRA